VQSGDIAVSGKKNTWRWGCSWGKAQLFIHDRVQFWWGFDSYSFLLDYYTETPGSLKRTDTWIGRQLVIIHLSSTIFT
jgi:hypothetical protein